MLYVCGISTLIKAQEFELFFLVEKHEIFVKLQLKYFESIPKIFESKSYIFWKWVFLGLRPVECHKRSYVFRGKILPFYQLKTTLCASDKMGSSP